jgi:non-canonical poly(A) RNA polymerase PAPD5/7
MSQNSRYPSRGKNHHPPREYRNDRDSRNRNGPPPRDAYRAPSYSGRYEHNPGARWNRDGGPPPSANYRGPPSGDNYRLPQADFTFQVDKPAGVQDADTYRPQGNRKSRNDRREPHSPDRDSRPSKRNRGPHDRSFGNANGARPFQNNRHGRNFGNRPWRPFVAAERELLKTDHNTNTEVAFFNTAGGVTYRPLNELSDSDEAEMDISGDEKAGSDEEPTSKRARSGVEQSASDNNTPKWSNPDPYTALPPESATQEKKKDVVRMIRKSRVQEKEVKSSLPSGSADFISFDSDSNVSDEGEDDQEQESLVGTAPSAASAAPVAQLNLQLPPKPPKPGKTAVPFQDPTPSALGSRKRTHDDEIKMPHTRLKKVTKAPAGGGITQEWLPDPELESTPWMELDHSGSANMAVWLHKEVVDFYEYIKPRDFEERLRSELVRDLKQFCRKVFRDAEVYPFGSFPSGLYLPTGDMDMAFMSDGYVGGGVAKYFTKATLHRFKAQLINHQVAWEDEIELILHAKVPLVKFIEHKTGLKVDVSFENDSGVTAIATFKAWRDQYPGMPALVTLIKHFLLMRGLNEPVNGGIGGFSVICLVVSMLQMMPEVQSGNLDTRHHLGQLLLHFLDLYGNKFNYQTIAISLNPPRWIPKVSSRSGWFLFSAFTKLTVTP